MSLAQKLEEAATAADQFITDGMNTDAEQVAAATNNATAQTEMDKQSVDGIPQTEAPQPHDANTAWQERYKILQGKYNAELPRLNDQLKAKNSEIEQLRSELSTANAHIATSNTQAPQAAPASHPSLDALKDEYPAELIDGLLAEVQRIVQPLDARVSQVTNDMGSVSERTGNLDAEASKSVLRAILKARGMDFDEVNADPLFVDWLDAPDEKLYGQARNGIFGEAYQRRDFETVANFFSEYASGINQYSAPNLANHVTPTGTATSEPVGEPFKWSPEMINSLYASQKLMDPAEFAAAEQSLFAVIKAG